VCRDREGESEIESGRERESARMVRWPASVRPACFVAVAAVDNDEDEDDDDEDEDDGGMRD
jgi:hypothetical protein